MRLSEMMRVASDVHVAELKGLPLQIGTYIARDVEHVGVILSTISPPLPPVNPPVNERKRPSLVDQAERRVAKVRKMRLPNKDLAEKRRKAAEKRAGTIIGRFPTVVHDLIRRFSDKMLIDVELPSEVVLFERCKDGNGEGGRLATIFVTPEEPTSMRTF